MYGQLKKHKDMKSCYTFYATCNSAHTMFLNSFAQVRLAVIKVMYVACKIYAAMKLYLLVASISRKKDPDEEQVLMNHLACSNHWIV